MIDNLYTNPIVSFSRAGKTIVLGRTPSDDVVHLYGSTGLGLPPVQLAFSDRIGGDGSVFRGQRYGNREVFIPLAVWKKTKAEVTEFRRRLYHELAPHKGMVNIRIVDPGTGTSRFIEGYLKEGLEGDFGEDFRGNYQSFGLTFECPDPWWQGDLKEITLRLNPGVKPFISNTVPFFPVVLGRSAAQGTFNIEVAGDDAVYPVWEFVGEGSDPTIKAGSSQFVINTTLKAGQKIVMDMGTGMMTPDQWQNVPLTSQPFRLEPGRTTLTATMVNATVDSMIRGTYRERFLEGI